MLTFFVKPFHEAFNVPETCSATFVKVPRGI